MCVESTRYVPKWISKSFNSANSTGTLANEIAQDYDLEEATAVARERSCEDSENCENKITYSQN